MKIHNHSVYGTGHLVRLIVNLAVSRFRQRIAGKYLGIAWYLLEPLIFFLILLLLQVNIGASNINNYPAYLLLGLIMINFWNGATNSAVGAIREHSNLVQSINIDTKALPLSMVLQFCFSHVFEFVLFIIITLTFHVATWSMLFYPLFFIIYAIFVAGSSLFLATIGVFIEDFNNIWTVVTRLLWLGTPIFYALTPGTLLYKLNLWNPLYYFITAARSVVVYNMMPDWSVVFFLVTGSLAIFVASLFFFDLFKKRFNEFI